MQMRERRVIDMTSMISQVTSPGVAEILRMRSCFITVARRTRVTHLKQLTLALGLMLIALFMAPLARALDDTSVEILPVLSTSVTSSGQKIVLPQKDARISVSLYDVAAGAVLPEHKHPFPRYGYVLSGTLQVTNTETGKIEDYKPGDFIVESVDQWHKGANIGREPLKLLVIDMTEGEVANTVVK
jgi:quercetin dioxygenase-like cupin family protein